MVQIVIDNMLRVRGAPVPLKAEITKRFTIDNPEYKKRKVRKIPCWGIEPKITLYRESNGTLILPRGFVDDFFLLLLERNLEYTVSYDCTEGQETEFGRWSEKFAIRSAQEPCLTSIFASNGCLIAPAGSGKTIMGLRRIYEERVPALWITHTLDLLEQTTARAKECMPDIGKVGRIAEGEVVWGSGKLIVATYQTLMNNDKVIEHLNQFIGLAVVDECHHVSSECFSEVVSKLTARYRLGLTATPDRKDGLEAMTYAVIGPKLYEIDRKELYDGGRLIKPEIRFVYTDFDYDPGSVVSQSGAVDAGGEELNYHKLMQELIGDQERLGAIADNILKQKGFQLVISDSIPYCHYLYDKMIQLWGGADSNYAPAGTRFPRVSIVHGTLQRTKWIVARSESDAMQQIQDRKAINAKYDPKVKRWKVQVIQYDEETYKAWNIPTAVRKEIMQAAADRKIDILIATGQLVQEGLDLPHLNHGHLVTPKRGDAHGANNGISVEQAVGRLMRPDPLNPNKKAVWWDYVDHKVGVHNSQYSSRRKVYSRLGLSVPKKPRGKKEETVDFLSSLKW